MSIEAMKLALEALDCIYSPLHVREIEKVGNAMNALRQAIEQAQRQEPVAWRTFDGEGNYEYRDYDMNENYDKEWADRNPNHAHWVQPLIVKE